MLRIFNTQNIMEKTDKYDNVIRFDWAAKYIFRDKADFTILEGLVSAIIGDEVTITELLESESNQQDKDDKFNRVDIKAKNSKDEIILIEIQQSDDLHFLQRILYSTAKTITEHIKIGKDYTNVKKVYSINILYFNLGIGDDYLYHGQSELIGVHTKDRLILGNSNIPNGMRLEAMNNIFPEYYVLRVNQYDETKEPTSPREEWARYLKTGYVDPNTKVPGLQAALERLNVLKMNAIERKRYEDYRFNRCYDENLVNAARYLGEKKGYENGYEKGMENGMKDGMKQGMEEGMKKGMEEGMKKGMKKGMEKGMEEGMKKGMEQVALKMKAAGMDPAIIVELTGVVPDE